VLDASDDWVVIHLAKDGTINFEDATPYLGKGNFEAAQGLLAGVAISDSDRRPCRLAARGGVGAVMGSKKVKAIVVDLDKNPDFYDPKRVRESVKDYAKMLIECGQWRTVQDGWRLHCRNQQCSGWQAEPCLYAWLCDPM